MNLQRKMSTDYCLWIVFIVLIFILLGFFQLHIDNVENKIGPTSFWRIVFWAPDHLNFQNASIQIFAYGTLIFVPSVALGWVGQAIVVAVRTMRHSKLQNPTSNSSTP